MKANFFEQLAGLHKGTLLLNIHTDEEGMQAVSVVVRKNTEATGLPPMLLNGTPQELDAGFFEAVTAPIQKTGGLLTNLDTYQKEVDKAGKLAKEKSKPNKGTATPAGEDDDEDENTPDLFQSQPDDKEAKAQKKREYEEQMEKVKKLAQDMKYTEALAQLPDEEEHPDKAEAIVAKRKDLERGKAMYDQLQNQFND